MSMDKEKVIGHPYEPENPQYDEDKDKEIESLRAENERLRAIDERESLIAINVHRENERLRKANAALLEGMREIAQYGALGTFFDYGTAARIAKRTLAQYDTAQPTAPDDESLYEKHFKLYNENHDLTDTICRMQEHINDLKRELKIVYGKKPFIPEYMRKDIQWIELRPAVRWFAEYMEKVLQANDHKGGWHQCTIQYLYEKLDEEVGELSACLSDEEVIREAADVANIAMMIADRANADLISKQGVLDYIERRQKSGDGSEELHMLESDILIGEFDIPEPEHIKAYWAREGLIKHFEGEVQRLREALTAIASIKYDNLLYSEEDAQCMQAIAAEALSPQKGETPNDKG